jgi:hypothetical protein
VIERPVHTIETNVHGTETVLRHARRHGKLVLIASTSEVYGKSAKLPFREDADLVMGPPSKTRWGYATSKLLDEFLALGYWKGISGARDRRSVLQYRRSAPERAIRDGAARISSAGRFEANRSRSMATAVRRAASPGSATWCRR